MYQAYDIPSQNLRRLVNDIVGINRKNEKWGLPSIVLEEQKIERRQFDQYLWYPVYTMALRGESPILKGWRFVAIAEHHEGTNDVHVIPGEIALEKLIPFVDAPLKCDHCGLERERSSVFILQHTVDEKLVEIGRSCLADFLGTSEAMEAARQTEYLILAADACQHSTHLVSFVGRGSYLWDTQNFLEWAAACIRVNGYVTHQQASRYNMVSTSESAREAIVAYAEGNVAFHPTDEDKEYATRALAWVRGLTEYESDYARSLYEVCTSDLLSLRQAGLAVSVFTGYDKAREFESFNAEVAKHSEWQGKLKVRSEFTVNVIDAKPKETRFGVNIRYLLLDDDGNYYEWFASAPLLENGGRYKIVGQVRVHDIYNGIKRTVLSRCKVAEIIRHGEPVQLPRATQVEQADWLQTLRSTRKPIADAAPYRAALDLFLRTESLGRFMLFNTVRTLSNKAPLSLELYADGWWSVTPGGEPRPDHTTIDVPLPILPNRRLHELGEVATIDVIDATTALEHKSWFVSMQKHFREVAVETIERAVVPEAVEA